MSDTDKLQEEYQACHKNIVQFLLTKTNDLKEQARKKDGLRKQEIEFARLYEAELLKRIHPMLCEIAKALHRHPIKIKNAFIQFNSLNVNINARIRLPWYGTDGNGSAQEGVGDSKTQAPFDDLKWDAKQADWTKEYQKPNGLAQANHRDLMYLHPDRPTHLMTEILWRLKPTEGKDRSKGWIGVIKEDPNIAEQLKKAPRVFHATSKDDFDQKFCETLNTWKRDNKFPLVELATAYDAEKDKVLVETARQWLWEGKIGDVEVGDHGNIFYLPDIAESEQLAGIDMELDLKGLDGWSEVHALDAVNDLLYDCQWHISQYVTGLISRVEKTHSSSGGLYRDAYFSPKNKTIGGETIKIYPMLESLVDGVDDKKGFLCWDRYKAGFSDPNKHFLKNIFDKVRTHFEVAKGIRGDYWLGYKSHAYEVACTVAGIMDVLFEFGVHDLEKKRNSIEDIVRRSGPHLEKIQEALHGDEDIPYLFEQIFQGLVTEHQLFLTPMYREHFIHSFYVFVFGLIFMSTAPSEVIRGHLVLKGHKDKTECRDFLKRWFLVSMWHDIAYILQKGNEVLENYVTRFMRDRVRYKGLLPWIPALGNLMQVNRLLEEIRTLSSEAITVNKELLLNVWDESETEVDPYIRERCKATFIEGLGRLPVGIVIAAAFERRDHGIWSALMVNHGWDKQLSSLFGLEEDIKDSLTTRKVITSAIMPHHLADWKVEDFIGSLEFLKNDNSKKIFEDKLKAVHKEESAARDFKVNPSREWLLAIISHESNPLGYLLALSDMVCQAGREAPELAGDVPSDLRIRFDGLVQKDTGINPGALCVRLSYKKEDHQKPESIKKFYQIPGSSIGLDSSGKGGNSLRIEIKKDGGTNPGTCLHINSEEQV